MLFYVVLLPDLKLTAYLEDEFLRAKYAALSERSLPLFKQELAEWQEAFKNVALVVAKNKEEAIQKAKGEE